MVSRTSRAVALRDCGVGLAPGEVRLEPTLGKPIAKPCWFAVGPVNMPAFSSDENFSGSYWYATETSLTMLRVIVERSPLLSDIRIEVWPACTGNPGKLGSTLFSVSGASVKY